MVLRTPQLEILKDFYAQLGFEFIAHQHGKGPRHYAAESGGLVLEIYPLDGGRFKKKTSN
ncbi:MAG: hypothetical protein AAFR61_16080 [Bacteroidota bacterium]